MIRDEYNAMLQDVQRLEIAIDRKILEPFQSYDKDGRLVSCGYSHQNRIVFRQTNPFTEFAEYSVYAREWGKIMYADPTR